MERVKIPVGAMIRCDAVTLPNEGVDEWPEWCRGMMDDREYFTRVEVDGVKYLLLGPGEKDVECLALEVKSGKVVVLVDLSRKG